MGSNALTNREIAALVALGAFSLFVIARSRPRGLWRALWGVLKTAASPWVSLPLVAYVAWVAGWVVLAEGFGLWELGLLKASILWLLLSGLALIYRVNDAVARPGFFRRALVRSLGVAAFVEFLAALESFPLWIEVPALMLVFLFVGVQVLAERDPKQAPAAKVAGGYLVSYGVAAVAWSVVQVGRDWAGLDRRLLGLELALPVWLTAVALLFVYGFALVVSYDSAVRRMRVFKPEGPLWRQRLATVLRANLRLRTLRLFSGSGPGDVARAEGFRGAWRGIGGLQREAERKAEEREAVAHRLAANAGLQGDDASGRRLDQREFAATQAALRWLSVCHMGHYRSGRSKYRADLLPLVESAFTRDGLPEEHRVRMYVRPDGQAWYATRQTVTGWWFAIGACGPPPSEWFFDGPESPAGFPSQKSWDQFAGGPLSPNWD